MIAERMWTRAVVEGGDFFGGAKERAVCGSEAARRMAASIAAMLQGGLLQLFIVGGDFMLVSLAF